MIGSPPRRAPASSAPQAGLRRRRRSSLLPYACDLLVVGLDGRTQQEAAYFRGPSGRYGYVWPAVSPDGRYLAVVRTLREQRPSQRNVTHELLRIDLETGEEHVLATAGDGRFDRVVYADNRTIIVVRSFRSSSGARCTPDSCTDWAEVLLVREGSVSTLPNQIAGPPFRVSITPLGVAGPLWISASTRQIESFASGLRLSRSTHCEDRFRSIPQQTRMKRRKIKRRAEINPTPLAGALDCAACKPISRPLSPASASTRSTRRRCAGSGGSCG
jgi:hypothetical protein